MLIIGLIMGSTLWSQSKLIGKCEGFLIKAKFEEGLNYLEKQDAGTKADDPYYNYYMGMMHYYLPHRKKECTPFFEAYLNQTPEDQVSRNAHDPVYYFLGEMYHLNYDWTKAQQYYQKFIDKIEGNDQIPAEEKSILTEEPLRRIGQCDFGKILEANPRHVLIESLGDTINTMYPEYAAVVSQNEERLIFTSRRPDTEGGKLAKEGGYYEDLYTADLVKGSIFENTEFLSDTSGSYYFNTDTDFDYVDFRRMGSAVNSKDHDGSIQLFDNDEVLYFYHESDIWKVRVGQDSISASKLGDFVNSEYHEPSIFFSKDGSKLFIVSDRPGGFGGLDIYMSVKEGGSWSEPKNLGPKVNTPLDEDAPYFDPDGITLYFSSQGHSSVGGFDVFRTRIQQGEWTDAVNMGFPLNTPADDIYFSMTSRYNRGYYASSDLKGKGGLDLYRVTFADERDPVAELFGVVKKGDSKTAVSANIVLESGNERITKDTKDTDGDYFLILGHGKSYEMKIETEGFVPFEREFSVPEQDQNYQLYQEVHVEYIEDSKGSKIGQQITVYSAVGNKTETTYYNEETQKMIDRIKSDNKINGDMYAMTLVHLYHTQNELSQMMEEDESFDFDFSGNTEVFLMKDESEDKMTGDSYQKFDGKFNRDEVLNPNAVSTIDATTVDGLFFTVQIGVYSRDVPHSVLFNLEPLVTRKVNNNIHYRYSIGTFRSFQEAEKRMKEVVAIGVKDAFVTAYYKGERIGPEKAKALLEEFGPTILKKN